MQIELTFFGNKVSATYSTNSGGHNTVIRNPDGSASSCHCDTPEEVFAKMPASLAGRN